MAEHVWTVLCRRILTDRDNNATSLVDMVEILILNLSDEEDFKHLAGIEEQGGRIYPADFNLLSQWTRSDEDKGETVKMRVLLEPPRGPLLPFNQEIDVDLEKSIYRRIRIRVELLTIADAGRHWFVVEKSATSKSGKVRWERVARIPLEVVARYQPGQA